jgi:TrmH family RNA methyltransferase
MSALRSRDNPRVRRWHALTHDAATRRQERSVLLEGPHLVAACLDAGVRPKALLVSESGGGKAEIAHLLRRAAQAPVTLADALFRWVADAATPAGLAAEIDLPHGASELGNAQHAVFLDAVQDAGNVGAILRSAAAFGVDTAILGKGCADAWSPKVLRAAMGGHFGLRIAEAANLPEVLGGFKGRLVCAATSGGAAPATVDLRGPVGWILGSEGQGVSAEVAKHASLKLSVPLAPGAESLNVAAAAAVLLYERARQLSTGAARS